MNRAQLFSALSNWLAFAATLAVAFFLTPVLVARLGPARYDVWCVAEAILAFFTLLDMGLAACLVRGVARHRAVGEDSAINRLASTTLLAFSAAGLIALAAGAPVMLGLAPRLGDQTGDAADVRMFLLLMLVNLAITLPLSVFPSILDGLERYPAKSLVRVVCLGLRTVAILAVTAKGHDLTPLAVAFALANLLEHLALAVLSYRFLPTLSLRIRNTSRDAFREIRRFSVDAFLAMLAGRITVQTGIILIGLLLPVGQATIFATAARLVEYAKTLLRTITATLSPGVSALEARGDWDSLRALFLTVTRLVLLIALPIQFGLWFFGEAFLTRWVPEVGARGVEPLMILALSLTPAVAQSVASRLLYGLGRLKLFARLALAEAVLNVILLAALTPSQGLTGVALAVTIPNLLFCVAVLLHTLKVIEVPVRIYLTTWLRPLLCAAIPAAIWWWRGPAAADWSSIAGGILAGLIPYLLAAAVMEWAARPRPAAARAPIAPRRPRWSGLPSR